MASVAANIINDEHGKPSYYLTYASDISNKIELEQKIATNQNMLQLVFDVIPQAFFKKDKNGNKMSKRLGNAADPFETIETYSADASRWYMISNASPWDNLKFNLEGLDEVRRKFFGTLYNTYSFFALYANIDRFSYKEPEMDIQLRPEIDRWIISRLNTLIEKVKESMDDYEPTKATRLIQEFVVDDFSNWWVRLCRKRFWRGEYEADKISAYQTLYTCMVTIAKLGAPIAPFFMDKLYLDLNNTLDANGILYDLKLYLHFYK